MDSTPRQHPSVQRVNRAYVDVPPSPLTAAIRRAPGNSLHVVPNNIKRKENTPLHPSQMSMSQGGGASTSLKRKFLDSEPSLVLDGVMVPAKKAKPSAVPCGATVNVNVKQFQGTDPAIANTITDEEFVYCHQCNQKRDAKYTITCSVVFKYTSPAGNSKERTCRSKYCKQCLRNRYNEDINTYRSQGATTGYKCPRCRDVCNCQKCQKVKGLEPLGKPRATAKSTDAKAVPKPKANDKDPREKEPVAPKMKGPVPQKQPPVLNWQRVPISLSRDEVDNRILIREFVFRFADCLEPSIAKSHMEELEILASRSRPYENEDDETACWVNDMCLKVVVLGLLGLLSKDYEGNVGRLIKVAVKDVRTGGVNLNKLWSTLSSLRDDVAKTGSESPSTTGNGEKILGFPDPLPPPASATTARSLRSDRVSNDMINVVQSSQMIPVIVSLVHSALATRIIREEIEQGSKDSKDVFRDAKEAIRIENERWEKERTTIEVGVKDKARKAENRAKRSAHKDQITDIENALKLVTSTFAPRFMPLGTDDDGRVYYALSPGAAEREAAFEYLEVATHEKAVKLKKKGRVPTIEERQGMRDWSWFVAVWGTKHPSLRNGAKAPKMNLDRVKDSKEEGGDDETVPKWWGFWDAEEITKLAEFITIRSGIEDDVGSSSGGETPSTGSSSSSKRKQPRIEQLKKLAGALREYAVLLQWRSCQDKYTLIKGA